MSGTADMKAQVWVRQHERHVLYRDPAIVYEGYSEEIPLRVPDLSTYGMFINTPRTVSAPESWSLQTDGARWHCRRVGISAPATLQTLERNQPART